MTTTAASETAPIGPASEMQPAAAARLVAKLGLVVPAMQRDLGAMWALPDVRSMFLGYHYTFAKLPDTPMHPRPADERVG